jgi:formiminoglutamase
MFGVSSSAAEWFTRLEPARVAQDWPKRSDDPRLGEFIQSGRAEGRKPPGNAFDGIEGRAILVGFPQDEGVRRNHGRAGAAQAPDAIRYWLYRLTPWDGLTDTDLTRRPPVDAGNLRMEGNLEETQQALAEVVGGILHRGGVPVVLGGGHETALGHYLGHVLSGQAVAIVNLDAHLDVRPHRSGMGHSGSPFRQAMVNPQLPLLPRRYACLGAQPQSVSRDHATFVRDQGGTIRYAEELQGTLLQTFQLECSRLGQECPVYVTLDADVVRAADVPGVSAPNPCGLSGAEVTRCARWAGSSPQVRSFDLVEINPSFDTDQRSCRWAALVIWCFLIGLAGRRG